MSHLRIINRTRGTVVGSRVAVASGWWSRLRGFLGRPQPNEGEGILLVSCNMVHTFGMTFPLDVLFLSAEGEVLDIAGHLQPWKRSARVGAARYVLEVPAGTIEATGTQSGDEFTWMPPQSGGMGSPHAELSGWMTAGDHASQPTPPMARRT